MSVLNQLSKSTLSLQGNGFNPAPHQPAWGYPDQTYNDGGISPELSNLHNTYSTNNDPSDIWIQDFNRSALGGVTTLNPPSKLDELDPLAPKNSQAGKKGSVVSKVYKSKPGLKYKDLGPTLGRY